ncbi:MAG: polymer-forming cytoskeletal protein [Verrucomicrobiales bacterium]|nr:polymer-forming cytoskeletal protein [Verrucomicrobiales bacterium]
MLKQIINQDDTPDSGDKPTSPSGGGDILSNKPKTPAPPMTLSKNIISSDVQIKGKLRFSNDLIIDGRIDGEVNSEGDLTVGENAQIVGDIKTRTVVVFGKIHGNITVTDRCELKQNAELHGDVVAGKLAIEEGAAFMGASTVGAPSKLGGSKPVSSPPQSSSESPSGDEDSK